MLVTLNEHQARQILAENCMGRLGCIVDRGPYIVPINYYYEDENIYSHSLPGTKISALRQNPRSCLQVDEIITNLKWRSVLAYGTFEEIVGTSQKAEVLNKLLTRGPMLTPVESQLVVDASAQQVITYRIRIDRVTGVAEE